MAASGGAFHMQQQQRAAQQLYAQQAHAAASGAVAGSPRAPGNVSVAEDDAHQLLLLLDMDPTLLMGPPPIITEVRRDSHRMDGWVQD